MPYLHSGKLHGPDDWIKQSTATGEIIYHDHLGGFDVYKNNDVLNSIKSGTTVRTEYLLDHQIKKLYPNINIKFDAKLMIQNNYLKKCLAPVSLPDKEIKNFLCCFNYGYHVGREKLVVKLIELGWFDFEYCTKGFALDGYTSNSLHTSLGVSPFQQIRTIPSLSRYDLKDNIKSLSPLIQKSFVQLVSETIPDSYVPFPTEKILFPIVNKTLWVAYAPPGYHTWIEKYFGFKRHTIFDYEFDQIQDPTVRLDTLVSMLSSFSAMSQDQWHEIYLKEKDIIEFNFDWAQSKKFIQHLEQFDELS
jgi:hypothetical protein